MDTTLTDKRVHKRCKFERRVEVWHQDSTTSARPKGVHRPEVCRSRDISQGGIKIETAKPIPLSTVVKLDFQMFEEKPVQVFAKVVWTAERCCGLQFMTFDGPR